MDAPGAEAGLGDHEAAVLGAEPIGDGDAAVLVADLAVAAAAGVPHHRYRADQVEARRVGRDDDLTLALVRRGIGIRRRHHDGEAGAHRSRGEPLVSVDHVVVAVAIRAGLKTRRVGPGDLRLGHREAGADLPLEQGLQEPLLDLRAAELGEDLRVPRVRRLAVEDAGRDRAPAHDLAERGVLEVGDPRAVFRIGKEEVPEAQLLRLRAHLEHDGWLEVRVTGFLDLLRVDSLGRVDVLVHEAEDLILDQLGSVGHFKQHRISPFQGSTLTLTIPVFFSEARANARSMSSSGTEVVVSSDASSRSRDKNSMASLKSAFSSPWW